jgi:hypothetical protein
MNNILNQLMKSVESVDYCGYDPYDGLNSRLLCSTPLYKNEFVRLIWIQLFKRFPINLRGLMCVPRSFNPKAGGLFLLSYVGLMKDGQGDLEEECIKLIERLKLVMIQRAKGLAWGYNFDWQAKAFYVPVGTPNVVSSVYIGNGLLDFFDVTGEEETRRLAQGVKEFILSEMVLREDDQNLVFAYIPNEKAEVHNASLLAAAFLSRFVQNDLSLAARIHKAVRFSIGDIQPNGYWPYGTMPHHRWMDNFHTAFNLEALLTIRKNLTTTEYDEVIHRVFGFYIENFFLEDGIPKYYLKNRYPIDVHTIAESIVFLSKVVDNAQSFFTGKEHGQARDVLSRVVEYAFRNFWDKRGYFYFQKERYWFNKINYLRWSQAWMFYALCCYQGVKDVKS